MPQLSQKAAVLAGIVSRRFAFSGPLFANLCLTTACNLSCRYCRFHNGESTHAGSGGKSSRFLDFGDACRFLTDLQGLGTDLVILTGEGEPLLYPRLVELVRECRARKIQTEVFSNGIRLDPALSAELVDSGPGTVKISVMADCAEHYEVLRQSGRSDTWDRVWKGVDSLVAARREAGVTGPRIVLHYMVCRPTRDRLDVMVEQARRSGADSITFTPLVEWDDSYPELTLAPEDISGVCRDLRRIAGSLNGTALNTNAEEAAARLEVGPHGHEGMRCWIGWLSTRVQTNGDVYFCHAVDRVAGNIGRQSFREIWQSEEYRSFRRVAARPGGIMNPELRASCHYCCFHPHHERIRKLATVPGFAGGLRDVLTGKP